MRHLLATMTAVHAPGALVGTELWYRGLAATSLETRIPPLVISDIPGADFPGQAGRIATRTDLAGLRALYRAAARGLLADRAWII